MALRGTHVNQKDGANERLRWRQAAIAAAPANAAAHTNLGLELKAKGQLDEAIACWKKAIALDPKLVVAHTDLGTSDWAKGLLDESIVCFKKAIELDPKFALYHNNLGHSLKNKGELDDAIACFKKAIELDAKNAAVHDNLGLALADNGRLDEAIACYQKALAVDPTYALARTNLAKAQRLAAARDKLGAFQQGSYTPASNDERFDLAELCKHKKLYHTAAGMYAIAFAADLNLAEDLGAGHRYNAACLAALAAAGQGEDAAKLDDKERTHLRQQARDWLRAELALRARQLETGKSDQRTEVLQKVHDWQKDSELASLRDAAALAKLPAEEQKALNQIWADVAAMLKRAAVKPK